MKKQKTYVLMVSKVFPATHPRRGQLTHFREKIMLTVNQPEKEFDIGGKKFLLNKNAWDAEEAFKNGWDKKIHTIRESYDLWARRAEKINAGEAILSLRQWSGVPYRSKQVEFLGLEKIGVQRIQMEDHRHGADLDKMKNIFAVVGDVQRSVNVIAKNDGLSYEDFLYWFRYKPGKRMKSFDGCVLHLTNYRYFCTI